MSRDFEVFSPVSQQIWDMKYRYRANTLPGETAFPGGSTLPSDTAQPGDATLDDTWARVAQAVAGAEKKDKRRRKWAKRFHAAMSDFAFLPAGRILAGAGTPRRVTLFNCFVMDTVADNMASIFDNVKEAALTMQQGGGIGHDFSTLRPRGAPVAKVGAEASGPVSFMDVWDAMCRTIMSAGTRRGAMMGTLACDHPDIEEFIAAKRDAARLRNFNLSVLVTDAFMKAVRADAPWDLAFAGKVYRTLPARQLWEKILRATYDYAEPGVIFIDRVNALNPLAYCETIRATNPCGEQPLPPHGACLLGSINLARLVRRPFEADAALDEARLDELVPLAIRFLDNTIDISNYPLGAQRKEAFAKRRIGLGVTGLADALVMCGLRYGTPQAAAKAGAWMARIERMAYLASAELAGEKGAFPLYDRDAYLAAPHVAAQDEDVRAAIARHGLRNGLLTSVAPTGTISLLAGNVSSGVEPVFAYTYGRRIMTASDEARHETVEDYAHRLYRHKFPGAPLTAAFVTAQELSPQDHVAMQAALQRHVDSAISKTVNCPEDISFDAFKDIYDRAFDLGLKGCTTYRPNAVTGAVLTATPPRQQGAGESPTPLAPDLSQPALPLPASPPPAPHGASPAARGGVVYMSQPLERDPVLPGYTYKLKWPDSDHAIYVTLNDIIQDGRRRPFEIFINSKNLEHYAWTVALTRMISAVFRRGGDVSFVVEELKAVFDPRGGQWSEGRYVPSLLAAIGGVIERHMIDTGFLAGPVAGSVASSGVGDVPEAEQAGLRARYCPRCSQPTLVFEEGCHNCRNCGWSKCG